LSFELSECALRYAYYCIQRISAFGEINLEKRENHFHFFRPSKITQIKNNKRKQQVIKKILFGIGFALNLCV
jgi:hypothetical protein